MKMDVLFGAKVTQIHVPHGVTPHVIIPKQGIKFEERDTLFSSLPISMGHLLMADKDLSFLLALVSFEQKKVIHMNSKIKYIGEVSIDVDTLASFVKDGMKILSNPNIAKDIL